MRKLNYATAKPHEKKYPWGAGGGQVDEKLFVLFLESIACGCLHSKAL